MEKNKQNQTRLTSVDLNKINLKLVALINHKFNTICFCWMVFSHTHILTLRAAYMHVRVYV